MFVSQGKQLIWIFKQCDNEINLSSIDAPQHQRQKEFDVLLSQFDLEINATNSSVKVLLFLQKNRPLSKTHSIGQGV